MIPLPDVDILPLPDAVIAEVSGVSMIINPAPLVSGVIPDGIILFPLIVNRLLASVSASINPFVL